MIRRQFLKRAAGALAVLGLPPALLSSAACAKTGDGRNLLRFGPPQPFDYAALKGQARALAQAPYRPHGGDLPPAVAALNWDQYQSIRYRKDHALWAGDAGRYLAQFFHLGLFFKRPVAMHEVANGQARAIEYDPGMFDYGSSGLGRVKLSEHLGFAGFRLNRRGDPDRDFAAFLGASYFRAVGRQGQYGLSARGLAIDTGMDRPEEFPDFVAFYLERPAADSDTLVVYALLDSPSVAGAYRFAITPGEPLLMDVDAALYPRKPIERLGIAPCTSMYQTGENDRRMAWDWRPEIHDSDGLAMHTGGGEWIWRPLTNPPELRFNMYADRDPKGFGLLQRDRDFDHYQDDGVFYDRRPCLWVEPKHGWGEGSVQLVEIPTVDETFDNIVAFWNPRRKPQPGEEWLVGYRLFWGAAAPAQPPLAQCVATRTGLGGVIGFKRETWSQRFAIDFKGGALAALAARNAQVEPVLDARGARLQTISARPQHEIRGYRVMFDAVPDHPDSRQIDLRLFLRDEAGNALSETWLYQWSPPPLAQRKIY
ncbi:glucan biosynthesis protein [Vulcaniibacterium tengchongense]|uniref:Glucans biosynthesis protein D n=1 Tax=Vulcaniibacterium tengchongense TaxID=1273429 RepID=A0A3N4VDU1_9GAMM|nr:glucan biosynthesis protein D [Vulcaniibacterium tengchongense]RPE79963.1 glucans biosynthesis protein [Vulcaniibacterium tengchongense]